MTFEAIQVYMGQYGLLFLFIIILLEYLNLPGFPAGIILPVAGLWAATTDVNLVVALLVSVIAAVLASWVLYYIGYVFGERFLSNWIEKHPKIKKVITKCFSFIERKGSVGIFISKLLPSVRTIICIPAGMVKMNFWKYTYSTVGGVAIWNFVLMGAGYFFGEIVLKQYL